MILDIFYKVFICHFCLLFWISVEFRFLIRLIIWCLGVCFILFWFCPLCVLDTNALSDVDLAKMFFSFVCCCFMPLIMFWEVQQILISRLPLIFGIISWATWSLWRKSLFMTPSWSLLLPLSSRRLHLKPNVDISDPFGIDFLCKISNKD